MAVTTTDLFSKILSQGVSVSNLPGKSAAARDWYRQMGKAQKGLTDAKLIRSSKDRLISKPRSGSMYFFQYDPKYKAKLPYYDNFPLIFMIEAAKGGFYGINFHYLPLKQRAVLMDALYDLATNEHYDETTRLKISYSILKSASKFKWFQPAFKRYLISHVRSRFIEIHPKEWDVALFLPVAAFNTAQTNVWSDSRKMVK